MKRVTRTIGVLGVVAMATQAFAANIVWDGTTDNNWTNGPQDNSGGGFPANGATGSNWTVDANPAGGLAVPDATTPGGNLIDYQYTGHTWTINGATISEDVQIKLDGGSVNVSNSSVSLLPSSATTTANLSGLNIGQNGAATAMTMTSSTLNVSRSNSGGRAMALIGASTLDLFDSTVNLTAEVGQGKIDLNNGSSMSLDSTSSLTATGQIDLFGAANTLSMDAGASVSVAYLRANSGGEGTLDLMVDFGGGLFTVSDANPFRDNSAFEGQFNWTGGAGSGTVVHTNASSTGSDLAKKVSQGFFSINGVRINPSVDSQASGIAALNADLATLVQDGTWFQVIDGGSTQTLVLVPEPASLALIGLGGLAMIRRRR